MPLHELLGGAGAGGRGNAALRASVLDHLRKMCRTRCGTVEGKPDYGLPDVNEMVHTFPKAIEELRAALQHTIETYEPRLTSARAIHVPRTTPELQTRFEVTAMLLLEDGEELPVRYETVVNASRGISVD